MSTLARIAFDVGLAVVFLASLYHFVRYYRGRRALLDIDAQLAAIQDTNAEAKPGDPHYQLVCEMTYTGFDDSLAYLRETAQKGLR